MDRRSLLLRADALFLIVVGLAGMRADSLGAFFGEGPLALVLAGSPHAAIGLVEAHGLAVIHGVLLLMAQPSRQLHTIGAAIHLLLGVSNLAFWQLFVVTGTLALGYLTTSLHAVFFALQLAAAITMAPASRRALA